MNRPARIVLATAGLVVGGAVFGALAALLAFGLAALATGDFREMVEPGMLLLVSATGALLGGVLLPSAAWIFLRRVPLGLAVVGTVAGTVAGGAVGWVLPVGHDRIGHALAGAIAGFLLATLVLRLRASAPRVAG